MTAFSPALEKSEPFWPRALTITAVVAATLSLRALNLNDPLWLDELHTSWVVSDSPLDVAPRAAIGNQTPLYFWLNWFIAAVYESEISLRLISYLSAGALAWLVADTLWQWCKLAGIPSVGPALCGGLLVAVDPVFIFYGTEARPYALLQLVAFWRLRQLSLLDATPTRDKRLSMIVSGTVMVWLHLTGALLFAGELAVIVFWRWQGRRAYSLRNWLIDLVIIGVACLPLAWLITFVYGRRQNFESMIPSPTFTGGFQILRGEQLFFPLAIVAALATVLDRFVIRSPNLPEGQPNTEEPATLRSYPRRFVDLAAGPLVWALSTMTVAALLHLAGIAPLFWGRYLIAVVVAMPIAAGAFCGVRSTPLAVFLALLVTSLCVQRTGLNERVMNQDETGVRAIDDRNLRWEEVAIDRRREPAWFDRPLPVLIDAGLIERDVSWKSSTEIERAYSCFPVASNRPYGIFRRAESWGLPRNWREALSSPYLPKAAIDSYRQHRGIVVVLISRKPTETDAQRLVAIIGTESGSKCHIEKMATESSGKVTIYWIGPADQSYSSGY